MVNNAGVIRQASAKDYTVDEWDTTTLEKDLNAAFILPQAAGSTMLKSGRTKIINVASVIAFQCGLNVVTYEVAKYGIAGLAKALANDWAKHGINVNAFSGSIRRRYILPSGGQLLNREHLVGAVEGKINTNIIHEGKWNEARKWRRIHRKPAEIVANDLLQG